MPVTIHNHVIDKLAVVVGVVSGFALYPQVVLIVTSADKTGVSIISFSIIFINSFVWLAYSIHRQLISLAIPSILNIFACGAVLIWYFTV